jgi:hypothetical protein
VLAAFAVHQASTAGLTVAGLAAAVAAYQIALPRRELRARAVDTADGTAQARGNNDSMETQDD